MERIKDLFARKEHTYSFELFPPKTDKGYENLLVTIEELAEMNPDFISCTYGAGGGSRDKTFDIVEHIEQSHNIVAMAHLTCVMNTKEDIRNIMEDVESRGIRNILALRGDPPADNRGWQPTDENFHYSSELTRFIRQEFGTKFGVAVAGFPEGHVLCKNREKDADFLKMKIDAGADFVITQLFFDNQDYFDYVGRLRQRGVTNRVVPGIIPVTDYNALVRFTSMCGASISAEVKEIFEPIAEDKDATLNAGIDFCIKQCEELLAGGAPGLHFYTLNKSYPTSEILQAVRK